MSPSPGIPVHAGARARRRDVARAASYSISKRPATNGGCAWTIALLLAVRTVHFHYSRRTGSHCEEAIARPSGSSCTPRWCRPTRSRAHARRDRDLEDRVRRAARYASSVTRRSRSALREAEPDPRRVPREWRPTSCSNLLEEFHGLSNFDQHVVSFLELLKLAYTHRLQSRARARLRSKAITEIAARTRRVRVPAVIVVAKGQKPRCRARPSSAVRESAREERRSASRRRASWMATTNSPNACASIHESIGSGRARRVS